jgi:heat shock protein HtpX
VSEIPTWLARGWQRPRPALLLIVLIGAFDGLAFAVGGVDGLLMGGAILGVLVLIGQVRSECLLDGLAECEIDPALARELRELIEELARQAGVAAPRLRVVSHSQPNAWTVGLVPTRSIILVTSALLSKLTRDELAGVLAHELAHIRSRDTVVMTILEAVAVCLIGLATVFSLVAVVVGRHGLVVRLLAAAVGLSTTLLAFALSREQEYRADEMGAAICGHPEWLIAALRKLNRQAARGSAHDGVVGSAAPFSLFVGGNGLDENGLLSSHPPISMRIARLERQLARAPRSTM